jgi:hypothetical protein
MTEIELQNLRDSLITINNSLDTMHTRILAIEGMAIPKSSYFEQLKSSFENVPDFCSCVTEACVGGTPTVAIYGDSDGFPYNSFIFEINGVAATVLPSSIEQSVTNFDGVTIAGRFYDSIVTYTNRGTSKVSLKLIIPTEANIINISSTNNNTTATLSVDNKTLTACLAIL